jgi:hypothetical protein
MSKRRFITAGLFIALSLPIAIAQSVASNGTNYPGRLVQASLVTVLDAASVKAGAKIEADTVNNVVLEDGFVVPAGSQLEGRVVGLRKPSKEDTQSAVVLKFTRLKTRNASREVHATLVAVASITSANKNPNSAQAGADDISTRAGMLGAGSASPMRSPQMAAEDSKDLPDTTPPLSPPVATVGAHVGSVIGLPGVKLSITREGSEFSASSTVKLNRGLQLMLKVAK